VFLVEDFLTYTQLDSISPAHLRCVSPFFRTSYYLSSHDPHIHRSLRKSLCCRPFPPLSLLGLSRSWYDRLGLDLMSMPLREHRHVKYYVKPRLVSKRRFLRNIDAITRVNLHPHMGCCLQVIDVFFSITMQLNSFE